MKRNRPLPFLLATLAFTAASFAACGNTPGRIISVTFAANGDGGSTFTTASGWAVTVSDAHLVVGGVSALAPRPTALLRVFSMPVALAHGGADEFATLGIRAEWLDQVSLDLLATTTTMLGVGRGIAGTIGAVEVDIDPPPAAIAALTHGHQAWVAGTATRAASSIAFEGGLDIADLTIARRVQGIPASGSVDDGSVLTVTAHLRSWLDQMQFDRLPMPTSGTTREIVRGTQPYNAFMLGARTQTAFAVANTVAR